MKLDENNHLMRQSFLRRRLNPIRPMPVPQRHYPHKIVCQNYMNDVNGLSFHDFSSWTLLYPLKHSNIYYLYKIFEKSHFEHIWSASILSQKWPNLVRYWARTLIFCMWLWFCPRWRPRSLDLVFLTLQGLGEDMLPNWKALSSKYGI